MASATVDSAVAASTSDGSFLRLDSIPIVDLRLLSQTELYSLSRCSSAAADPNRRDDVVIPIIDRSVFNESAGSRKQTYSRVRLAPADSLTSATPRGRTGHLRSTAPAYGAINRKSDPENVENIQIINLLKQFFVEDMNPADLFPVKIEYSSSLPVQQFSSPAPPSPPSYAGRIVLKRKRGRPRKTESLGNGESLAVEVSVINGSDVGNGERLPMPSLNAFVARDNEEDKDREVLNSDGVAVDLAALGSVEHPYWEEIRSRTEGLRTEEELLGFLARMNGRWGSRRKKKRIVDANEFGSKLPVGWKLLLSVKKKNGYVWMHCRRYISPSGLHFVSCKGVSSYLLSLYGMQDNQYNDIVIDADKLTSVPLAIQDDHELENIVSQSSSPPLDSVTGNHEIQAAVEVENPVEDRIGESLCCNKCNITFNSKDELLHHQSSLHRKNRNKSAARITDGVIIKDGKYECQFCHKTFSERHRYNGHVGTHVRFQARIAGELSQYVHPTSLNGYPTQDVVMEGSSQTHDAVEICNSITNSGPNIGSHRDKNDDHFEDLEDVIENMRVMAKATDIVTETNHLSVPEALLSSNVDKRLLEDICLNGSAAEVSKDSPILHGANMMQSSLSHNDAADINMNNRVTDNSEKPEQLMAPESPLLDSNDHVEECPPEISSQHRDNNDHSNQKSNKLKPDSRKLAVNELVFDLFGTRGDQEKDLAVSTKEKSDFEYLLCKDIGTTESMSAFGSEASKLENEERARRGENEAPYSTVNKVGETRSSVKCESENSLTDNERLNRHEEMQYETASLLQSWDEQENSTKKDDMEVFAHLADTENIYHYENNDGGVCRRKTKVLEFDSLQDFGNGHSSDLFSSSSARISSSSITGTELDTRLGVRSPFTSATDKQLSGEDNMISVFNNTMEDGRQDPSQGILLNNSGISEVSNEALTTNRIYTTPANPSELDGIENVGKRELSLSFGSLQTDGFNVESGVQKPYGGETHSSMLSSNIAADLEQGRPFEYSNISFNGTTHEPGSSFNVDWDGNRNKERTSSQNFMVGFQNNNLQTGECVAADESWRTSRDNVFGGCYDAINLGTPIPSSSFFPTYGLAPNKVQESSFGVNQNYGTQSDMMRQSRAQPVEYSFMGEQRVNSLHEEPKIFPYATNNEQGIDPSFWLGNDALKPNASLPTQPTSACVYCRNIFFHEPIQAGIQDASICPSCSSRFPGQFNVL